MTKKRTPLKLAPKTNSRSSEKTYRKPLPRGAFEVPQNVRYGRKKQKIYWWVYIWSAVPVIFIGALSYALVQVKNNPELAALIADHYLRPVIGVDRTVAMERILFNFADKIQQEQYKYKTVEAPQIADSPQTKQAPEKSKLNLDTIPTTFFTPLAGEGVWANHTVDVVPGSEVMADTFIRPDADRSYAFATLVKVDMSVFRLGEVAGRLEPGGKAHPGSGTIQDTVLKSGKLVAAFDGGFQVIDGNYGMYLNGVTYNAMQTDAATIIGHTDGHVTIERYQGQAFGSDVIFARQNCPMLIENGEIGTQGERNKKLWGRTLTSDIYTWRSGVGITADGNLVFAMGNALTPTTLAYALKSAGAVNAMQLDINPFWVRFNFFNPSGKPGQYVSQVLMKGAQNGDFYSYLHDIDRDFFYLTAK